MKKTIPLILLPALLLGISFLTGWGTDSNTYIGSWPQAAKTADAGEVTDAEGVPDQLAYYAYDAMLSFTYAAALAESGQLDEVPVEREGDTITFLFEDMPYRTDAPDARVNGRMVGVNSEEGDTSEVYLNFENDPEGLESISVTSSGPHGQAHNEGTFFVNGTERPFLEFTAYFSSRLNQPPPSDEPAS